MKVSGLANKSARVQGVTPSPGTAGSYGINAAWSVDVKLTCVSFRSAAKNLS